MKKIGLRKLLLGMILFSTLLLANSTIAQDPPTYDVGPVWRMVYYRFKPGQDTVFWSKIYPELKKSMAEALKQGEVIDSQFFANPWKTSPDDWDILLMLKYQNYAALDGLGPKSAAVYKKQYASPEEAEQIFKLRKEALEVISVRLVRDIPLK